MSTEINWWTDPKNAKEVKNISWWDHDQNKTTTPFPISIIQDGDQWTACSNGDTDKLIGEKLNCVASGDSKEDAILQLFMMIRITHEYSEKSRLRSEPWVPFRKGDWKQRGGRWFTIFGINFYFRYGKGMKGGKYIPFTKQNISIHSQWNFK